MRRDGDIPAVMYSPGKTGRCLCVKGADFHAALRSIKKGGLSTTLFELEGAADSKAIVKDIQYHTTTYEIRHLDLQEVTDETEVSINVPINFVGIADCSGVKLGGVFQKIIRKVPVRGKVKDIPAWLDLDVRGLNMRESIKLESITFPTTVKPLVKLNDVAAVVAKK